MNASSSDTSSTARVATRILALHASPRSGSVSRQLADELIARLADQLAEPVVTIRDLAASPVPPLTSPATTGMFLPPAERKPDQNAALEQSTFLVDELRSADVLVISSPMYNFGVTAQLKAWIDQIVVPGVTFNRISSGAYEGLLADRPVYIVTASGGSYGGDLSVIDFHRPYLTHLLAFVGLRDVRWIQADSLAIDADAAIARARAEISDVLASAPAA